MAYKSILDAFAPEGYKPPNPEEIARQRNLPTTLWGEEGQADQVARYNPTDLYNIEQEFERSAFDTYVPQDIRDALALGIQPANYGPGRGMIYGIDPRTSSPTLMGRFDTGESAGNTSDVYTSDTRQQNWLPWDVLSRYPQLGGSIGMQYEEDVGGLLGGELGMLTSLAAMIPGPWQPAVLALNAANSLSQGNVLGAAMSGLGAAGINPLGGIGDKLGIPSWLANAIGSTGIGMLSGMDFKDALKGAALGAGIGLAANTFAPVVNDAVAGRTDVAEVGQSAYDVDSLYAADPAAEAADWRRRGIQVADAGSLGDIATDAFYGPAVGEPITLAPGQPIPQPYAGEFETFLTNLDAKAALDEEDAANRDALEAGDNPPPEPTVTSADLERYAKIAKSLYEMLGSQANAGAPQRNPGDDGEMSPEEEEAYLGEVVSYLGLDPATMAAAGLTPGSPEYLEYILAQVDSIIGQVIGDANPDGEDFGALLRAKTAEELQALNRAIYIRGQLGNLAGPGQYADPTTGMLEDVAAPEGSAKFLPGVAAWQRGLARSAQELAGMRGQEAKRFMGGMLDRNPDLYRMQARRDATALREALEQQNPDLKRRRRGMFGDADSFTAELEGMNSIDLDRMLALLMGRDGGRQGAAVEELFGPEWQGV
jgi:hypothetical protein